MPVESRTTETVDVIEQGQTTNDQGEIVGGWMRFADGGIAMWYCPYIPVGIGPPDYLGITREVVENVTNAR